jgi:hypothetical protein
MKAESIIGLFVVILLFSILMPVAFTQLFAVFNSTGPSAWRGKPYVDIVLSLGALVALFVVIGLVVGLTYYFYTNR